MKLEEVKEAVNKYYSDTSRTKDETREGLYELMEDIRIMLDALR